LNSFEFIPILFQSFIHVLMLLHPLETPSKLKDVKQNKISCNTIFRRRSFPNLEKEGELSELRTRIYRRPIDGALDL